jgi:hypothetical protein
MVRQRGEGSCEVLHLGVSRLKDDTFSDTPSGAVDVITIELMGQEFVLMSAAALQVQRGDFLCG